ncbi:stage 0 sporulation family protein [bacterium]|nr:stage 0 sporulation family protein [bacterium]
MIEIVEIKFKDTGPTYPFDSQGLDLNAGDACILQTEGGREFGRVVSGPRMVEEKEIEDFLGKVIRKATEEDFTQLKENERREEEAFGFCLERIKERELPMKLTKVEYLFDGSKITFYFVSETRVDFREMVKDLAQEFKTRIELRQIGVRDEARMYGGFGPCGRPLCCTTFLKEFQPVSMKMAKVQDLALNPVKLSGICGRLMCCLAYESETYREEKKKLPREGSKITIPQGVGKIKSVNIIKKSVVVELEDGKEVEIPVEKLKE